MVRARHLLGLLRDPDPRRFPHRDGHDCPARRRRGVLRPHRPVARPPVGCTNAFMQLAGTRVRADRAGSVGGPGPADACRQGLVRRLDPAAAAQAPGAHGGRCSAGGRPGGPARGGRARRSAASPSTRPAPSGSSVPHGRSRLGACTGVSSTSAPSAQNTSSKLRENFASWSPSTKRSRRPCSPSATSRLRACWVTQAPFGWAVTPARWTRRVSSSMKNSTYSRRSEMVSTVKKSQATIPAACWRRNARQVVVV